MIYEETYRYLLTNVSSTELDACLYALLKMDWDGFVRASTTEIAEKIGTTKKYMNEIMKKFTSKVKGRFVFVPINTAEGAMYRFNIGKTGNMEFNQNTDRYCKKYNFFYTDSFRSLPINAKRLILMGAFRMSITKCEQVSIPVDSIVPNIKNKSILPFTKQRLIDAVNVINMSTLNEVVTVSIASNIFTRKEVIVLTFTKGTLDDYKSNYTERFLLRKKLYESGFQSFLSDEQCIEIEKVGKYIYTSLLRIEKENAKKHGGFSDANSTIVQLARFIYNNSIHKLALSLNSKFDQLSEPKQLSAYFSSIVYEIVLEEMAKYSHQAESVKSLLDNENLHKEICTNQLNRNVDYMEVYSIISPIKEKYKFLLHIARILENWCEEWVISRVTSLNNDINAVTVNPENKTIKKKRGWNSIEDGLNQRDSLRNLIFKRITKLNQWLIINGNAAVEVKERGHLLFQMKESLSSYFAITSNRIK
ncbi:hypothetical protein [Cytobacillus oceanisediminis]|uniref:hypothetical protein n=1 Tax=Cytobacillus oceanisediminis TaxID=665099 RepID=UPI001C24F49C|nr:hypothetical protein [Cytobacillus oceanisediminis]MBU8772106.1 hypothetical protein [Cytobacillus oceanisediminis]